MSNRLYVLIRKDLPPSYQAVQAGHAVAEWLLHDKATWQNETLIYLHVEDENKLLDWEYVLEQKGIKYKTFIEPDLEHQKTALATVCDSSVFANMKLFQV